MHIFISDSGLIAKVKILTAIKKRHESKRNKYYKSLQIKYTCRIITNKRSMPKKIKTSKRNKVFNVFIKHHTKLNQIIPKQRKPSTIKLQKAYCISPCLMFTVGFMIMTQYMRKYSSNTMFKEIVLIYDSCSLQKKNN